MESRHCGLDKRIFLCPVHNASTPWSLQAFGIRCMTTKRDANLLAPQNEMCVRTPKSTRENVQKYDTHGYN